MADAQRREMADTPRDVARVPEYLHQDKDGLWFAEYRNFRLRSAFQAIYRRNGELLELHGFEGTVRAVSSGIEHRASEFFHEVPEQDRCVIDRVCRAIHFRNFANSGGGARRIFVDLLPMSRSQFDDSAYDFQVARQRLERFGLALDQIVVEFIQAEGVDSGVLEDAVDVYRGMGTAIALDNFGSSPLDVERLVALKPDIVKLDGTLLREATARSDMAELVSSLIRMAIDLGAEVVVKGIGTNDEMAFAQSTDAEMYQGQLLAPYNPHLAAAVAKIDIRSVLSSIAD